MPQFKVIRSGLITAGDRGDWGVVYTPLGVFLSNEVEEVATSPPSGSTTGDGVDSTGSTIGDDGGDDDGDGDGDDGDGDDGDAPKPKAKAKTKKRSTLPSPEGSPE